MPDDPQQKSARPFPREAYVFGWLVIVVVAAEGINSLISGVLGTGIILICLIPVMVWLMHGRPAAQAMKRRRG